MMADHGTQARNVQAAAVAAAQAVPKRTAAQQPSTGWCGKKGFQLEMFYKATSSEQPRDLVVACCRVAAAITVTVSACYVPNTNSNTLN